jgi:hypothetical protein
MLIFIWMFGRKKKIKTIIIIIIKKELGGRISLASTEP